MASSSKSINVFELAIMVAKSSKGNPAELTRIIDISKLARQLNAHFTEATSVQADQAGK